MTCRGAMLVTLLLVVAAVSTNGARARGQSLAERFRDRARGRSLDAAHTPDDVTASSVSEPTASVGIIDDEEDLTTYAPERSQPEQDMEEIVDQEKPKAKPKSKPKNSLLQAGHAGEVYLVEEKDIPNLKIPKPLKTFIPKPVLVGSGVSVGVGLNIEDPEFGLERVGPVLIMGNNLRKRRLQFGGDNDITNETDSLATGPSIETTINPFNDGFDEDDFETTLGPISFNRRTTTASPTTLNESPQNLSDLNDTTIEANVEAENNVVIETAGVGDFSDIREITVGTNFNLGGPKRTLVTGEVIPVELESKSELEPEHKNSEGINLNSEIEGGQTTLVSEKPERPGSSSILGSLFNYFTQTERPQTVVRPNRPRPERPQLLRPDRPVTRPGGRPGVRPFGPRPRPSVDRPDILLSRPSPRPNVPEINSDSTTNRPFDTTIFPEESLGDELPSRSTPGPSRFSNFRTRPTVLRNNPSSLLPSKPIIESGFQGIPGENGEPRPAVLFRPGAKVSTDYDYDVDALPPSLPNLKIIPFVASDAVNPHQQGGNIDSFTGNDFRISSQDEAVTTTAKPITTERSTRRPLPLGSRRPSIVPPRRGFRPDGATKRPSIFSRRTTSRPGSRPSFIPPRNTPRDKITSEENRIAPSTSSPFRFTTEKSFTPFGLVPVEKNTESPKSGTEEEITTDDIPSTESNTVNTPTTPPRLPGPIITPKTPVEVNTPDTPPRLPEPIITTTKVPVEVNTPEAPARLPEPIISIKAPLEVLTPVAPLRLPGPIRPIITSSQSSSVSSSSTKPIQTDDISNLDLQDLQDIFGHKGTTRQPPRFVPAPNKPVILKKTPSLLPEIPSEIYNLFPLSPDPIVAQGLLKLSGCNIYGRMYQLDDRIKELSAECKECRCTPVGVQCLPVCA